MTAEIKRQVETGTKDRIHQTIIADLYDTYTEIGLMDNLTDLLLLQPPTLREPVIHTLTTHVTKEKPVFIYGLGNNSHASIEQRRAIAASVDYLWALSLIYDDIIDNDPKRAGKPAAWAKYGKEVAVASVTNGVHVTAQYLTDICGSQAGQLVKMYEKIALDSVDEQKKLQLGCTPRDVIGNYTKRMGFHTKLPIDILYPDDSEDKQIALQAIYHVNLAGQMLNDLKDMSSEYDWLRPGFTDIKAGFVSWPIAAMWEYLTPNEQEAVSAIFGKRSQSTDEMVPISSCFTPTIISRIKQQITSHYKTSNFCFQKTTPAPIAHIAALWIDDKMKQIDRLELQSI